MGIQHSFIRIHSIDNEWYNNLLIDLSEKDNTLCFYTLYQDQTLNSVENNAYHRSVNTNKLVFQMRYETQSLKYIFTEHRSKKMCLFRFEADRFQSDFAAGNAEIGIQIADERHANILKQCVNKYYNEHTNENNKKEKILKLIQEPLTISIKKTALCGLLKTKIAKLFDGIIDAHNIELFDWRKNKKRLKWNHNASQYQNVVYKFVLFDTKQYELSKNSLYTLNIFKPSECPHPFYYKRQRGISLTLPYKQNDFKYRDLVDYVFNHIQMSQHNLLYYHFKDLLNEFEQNDDYKASENDETHSISSFCMLAPPVSGKKDIVDIKKFSLLNAKFSKSRDDDAFDLFIYKNVSNKVCDRILTIKFVLEKEKLSTKTRINEIRKLKFVGFTLYAQINKKSTLQDVIDAHFDEESKKYLSSCYRIKIKKVKFTAIAENKKSRYRPYYEFMQTNTEDFIIFKVKTCSKSDVYLPIYS